MGWHGNAMTIWAAAESQARSILRDHEQALTCGQSTHRSCEPVASQAATSSAPEAFFCVPYDTCLEYSAIYQNKSKTEKHVIAGKRVAVAGAGIAGTAFALALEQACRLHRISPMPVIQLFERDASATARAGLGYSFSLRDDSGLGGLTVGIHGLDTHSRVFNGSSSLLE